MDNFSFTIFNMNKIILFTIIILLSSSGLFAQNFEKRFSFDGNMNGNNLWKVKSITGEIRTGCKGYNDTDHYWGLTGYSNNFHTFVYSYFNIPGTAKKVELSVYAQTDMLDDA